MRRYILGAHTKTDIKVHIIWIPKYQKRVLTSPVALRTRDILRQIAFEHELEIITGKVASDHVHMLIGYRPVVKRDQLAGFIIRIPLFKEAILGPSLMGEGIFC